MFVLTRFIPLRERVLLKRYLPEYSFWLCSFADYAKVKLESHLGEDDPPYPYTLIFHDIDIYHKL